MGEERSRGVVCCVRTRVAYRAAAMLAARSERAGGGARAEMDGALRALRSYAQRKPLDLLLY